MINIKVFIFIKLQLRIQEGRMRTRVGSELYFLKKFKDKIVKE